MRMKLNRSSQLVLVSAVSLVAAGLLTACGTLTGDFVYVTSAKAAGPNNYGEDRCLRGQPGVRLHAPDSHFAVSHRAAAIRSLKRLRPTTPTLYVVNEDDNTIVQFIIGNDGKLYPQNTSEYAGRLSARGCNSGQVSVCGGHLPAAAHLLDRCALLRLGCGIPHPD